MANTMVDIAVDLLHDIEEVDASRDPRLIARRNRVTASVMRDIGFSNEEIVDKLGYLPEPFGGSTISEDPPPLLPSFSMR
jgi:hypothetical protein